MRESGVLTRGGLLISSPLLVWLALPGRFSFWPLIFVCLVPLFFLSSRAPSAAKSFFNGFAAGIFFGRIGQLHIGGGHATGALGR